MTRASYLRTLPALGLGNLARVAFYRAGIRTGLHAAQRLEAPLPQPPFFAEARAGLKPPRANDSWQGKLRWYDWKEVPAGEHPPDWFAHPFGGANITGAQDPWWRIPDFGGGDIKNLWELSRFAWAPPLATQGATGDRTAIGRINAWIASWVEANPPYRGPNWKCGQEASIRVIHVLAAAFVLGQDHRPLPGLLEFVRVHLQRIASTVSYAIGQQNNHATSEAAALFVGGGLLERAGNATGSKWARLGRRLLEELATTLIERDGSFSQYSLNYHRLMLDAYSFAEAWRRRSAQPPLSQATLDRLRAAVDWLDAMIERGTGDGPNLGANDGARLIPLTDTDFRDFRPSLQLASSLFRDARAIEAPGPWDDPLHWLGLEVPAQVTPAARSRSFDQGGYHVLRQADTIAVLRYPRFRFRPSQADALHLDLWVGSCNLLRDGGSYSYNDSEGIGSYLAGTSAHNTIEFDGRDQMPRLSRFLFGEWLKATGVELASTIDARITAAAGYSNRRGQTHHRRVSLGNDELTCIDTIGGHFEGAVLRWRLAPGAYVLKDGRLEGDRLQIAITADGKIPALSLTDAPESLYYQQHRQIPVLEARFAGPATVVSTIGFGTSGTGRSLRD